jgi:hypothetical protein
MAFEAPKSPKISLRTSRKQTLRMSFPLKQTENDSRLYSKTQIGKANPKKRATERVVAHCRNHKKGVSRN